MLRLNFGKAKEIIQKYDFVASTKKDVKMKEGHLKNPA